MSVLDKFVSLGFSVSTPDSKIIDCRESIKELQNERDSILSELQKANGIIIDLHHNPPKLTEEFIAEIKAEAGRAGFIAGYHKMHIEFVGSLASSEGAEFAADQYAAKIRNAGTWLRDENVNGGKRQGHCKFCLDKVYPDDDYKLVDNKLHHSKCYNLERTNQGDKK